MYVTPLPAFHAGAHPIRRLPGGGAFRPELGGLAETRDTAIELAHARPDRPAAEQEAGDDRRRRAVARGTDLLDALDALKLAALRGSGGADALARLAAGLETARQDGKLDPGLAEVMLGIETRAAVELAKRRKAARLAPGREAG